MGREPECVDCIAEGVTNWRPATFGGPRCYRVAAGIKHRSVRLKDSARESKAIIHHSDLVLALYHDPDKPGEVDMCVVKNRRGAETPHHGGRMMWWRADMSSIVDPSA